MEVMLLGRVTLVSPHPLNAPPPMEVTGRPLIVFGMTKAPESWSEPVMVMVFPSMRHNNSAYREVEEKRRKERRQAVDFPGKGKRIAKISFIFFKECSMARVAAPRKARRHSTSVKKFCRIFLPIWTVIDWSIFDLSLIVSQHEIPTYPNSQFYFLEPLSRQSNCQKKCSGISRESLQGLRTRQSVHTERAWATASSLGRSGRGCSPLVGPPDTSPFPRQPWLPAEPTVRSRLWILSNSHGSYRHENLGDRTWTSLAWKRLVFLGQFLEPNAAVFHLTLIPLETDGASCRKFEGSFQNLAVASTVSDIILNIYYNLIPVLRLILR